MKKMLTALAAFAALTASGSAFADDYAGIYTTGVQYQSDLSAGSAYRVGLGFNNGFFDQLGVSADYLQDFAGNPLGMGLDPYWGAGAGVGLENGISLAPRGFVGLNYDLNAQAGIYGEIGARYTFYFNDDASEDVKGAGFSPYYRAGVNFNLR